MSNHSFKERNVFKQCKIEAVIRLLTNYNHSEWVSISGKTRIFIAFLSQELSLCFTCYGCY